MDYEKEYKEALERAKAGKPLDEVFPELKESEDERIRAEIVDFISRNAERGDDIIKSAGWIAYLERQKEQKPAEWSEEDEKMLTGIIERGSSQVPPYEPALREEQMEWLMNRLKSLRPQPHWKPSEEQMKVLYSLAFDGGITYFSQLSYLKSLYEDLKSL